MPKQARNSAPTAANVCCQVVRINDVVSTILLCQLLQRRQAAPPERCIGVRLRRDQREAARGGVEQRRKAWLRDARQVDKVGGSPEFVKHVGSVAVQQIPALQIYETPCAGGGSRRCVAVVVRVSVDRVCLMAASG